MESRIYILYNDRYNDPYAISHMNRYLTVFSIFDSLIRHEDIYESLGCEDSIIRERVFTIMSDFFNLPYDYFYSLWLDA